MALLPLESFRRILGYHPFHFFGLVGSKVPVDSACNGIVKQYAWQGSDAIGRSEITEAIEAAEDRLREYLGYSVAPHYISETNPWPKFMDPALWRYGKAGADGRYISLKLSEGYIQAVGIETHTLVGASAVTYSDSDSDGVNDTFVVSIATAITDPTQLEVYFQNTDRLNGEGISSRWKIQPVSVSISGGIATIRGRSWLLVKPVLYEGVTASTGLDPSTMSNFVTNLDIYQRTVDSNGEQVDNSQATLLWETDPCHGWFCYCSLCSGLNYTPASSAFDPAAIGQAVARCGIRDAKLGIVIPAQALRDSTTGIWTAISWATYREPDRVTIRYVAGYPLDNDNQMSKTLQVIVARLAAAEMGRRINACEPANQELYHWQFDLARAAGSNDEQYQISPADLDNPLGTRRGQVYAWKQIRNLNLQGGTALL